MNLLKQLMKNFSGLQLRERVLAVAVGCVLLVLGGNLLLLKPLQIEIDRLRLLENSHNSEISSVMKELADADGKLARGVDPLAAEVAARDDLLRTIAEADAFFSRQDATGAQVGSLVRNLLEESPGLVLVSLKTLPSKVFYSPPPPPPPPKVTDKAAKGVADLLGRPTEKESAAAVKPAALQKTIYQHGVEVTVQGKYTQLLSYMEKLQKFPKRVFWSDANLSVSPYPITVLKVVVFTLSDQPVAPLS